MMISPHHFHVWGDLITTVLIYHINEKKLPSAMMSAGTGSFLVEMVNVLDGILLFAK